MSGGKILSLSQPVSARQHILDDPTGFQILCDILVNFLACQQAVPPHSMLPVLPYFSLPTLSSSSLNVTHSLDGGSVTSSSGRKVFSARTSIPHYRIVSCMEDT